MGGRPSVAIAMTAIVAAVVLLQVLQPAIMLKVKNGQLRKNRRQLYNMRDAERRDAALAAERGPGLARSGRYSPDQRKQQRR